MQPRASSTKALCAALAFSCCGAAAQDLSLIPALHGVPTPPLAAAARGGDTQAVVELLAAGADANAVDRDGTPALHWAVRVGDRAMAERLVRAGADVNAQSRYGV